MLIRAIADLHQLSLSEPVILYGPYLGEFGHELMRWQGWVRQRLEADKGTTIAITRLVNHSLYSTTHVLAVPGELLEGLDCSGDELYKATKEQREAIAAWLDEVKKYLSDSGIAFIQYPANYARPDLRQPNYLERQKFARLGIHGLPPSPFGDRRFFMVYIRTRELAQGKNIPLAEWQKFLAWMAETKRNVMIGGITKHEEIERTDRCKVLIDLAPTTPELWLQMNIGYLQQADGAVISESGTMFLSMLTGCSTLVFGEAQYRARTMRENVMHADLDYREMDGLSKVTGEQMIEVFQSWEANARSRPARQGSRGPTHGLF